jgi:DNA-binding MurR/RpiR family transcriptional regulator
VPTNKAEASQDIRPQDIRPQDPRPQDAHPNDVVGSSDVIGELRRRYDELTHSQKRIAEYIVEHSEAVAFSTVDQMAARLDINPSTIVRFTYRLGLNGFPDLQERIRQLVRGQLSRASAAGNGREITNHLHGTSFGASLSHDLANLHRTIAGLSSEDLDKAVAALVGARRVYVVGGLTSYALAYALALLLNRLRSEVFIVEAKDGLSIATAAEMTADDCLVAFTFPRYAVFTHHVASWAKQTGTKVIAITDTPISAIGQIADIVLLAASAGNGMDNSLVAPMAVVNAVVNGVTVAFGSDALDRVGQRERLMHQWDAFLLKADGAD